MRKSLSKKITQILFLTSIGIVGYTAIQTPTVYAKNLNKDVKSELTVKQDKEKKSKILNITEIEYGKFYSSEYEYRVNCNRDEIYEKAVSEVSVNGKEYHEGKGYGFHYYGLQLNPKEFTKNENKIKIIANGYNDIEIIIKKDGTLISYKEIESKAPLLNVGGNIGAEEGQAIDLLFGVTAKDNKDGDLTSKIQVDKGKLDVNNPAKGFYTVTYSVTNSLGKRIIATKEIEVTERSNTSSNSKVDLVKVTDKIADGVYTLGFEAYKIDRPNETSMLGGFFDKNVKVTVKDGKVTLKMLNLMNAEMLYDFRVESKGKYVSSKSEWVGESNANGEYFMQTFEFPIEDLLSKHTGCVLVSAMGGNKSDIGNTDKYTKTKLVFDKILKKGWNGFKILNKQKSSDALLNQALKDMLHDEDGDGKISDEEISKANGRVDLVSYKFKDISRLKHLGKGVTILNLEANKIDKLPKGVFDNLVNLEYLQLNGNQIKELPKGIFDKLTSLKTLILAANKIDKLPKGIFDKLVNLEDLQLSNNKITKIEDGIFDKLINIKNLDLPNNNIEQISDNAFGDLKNLKCIFLYDNKLENIPKGIGKLENLESLNLSNNNITNIPKEVGKLKKLTDLNLDKNYVKDIPKEVYDSLKNIRKLDISNNQIKEVPKNILEIFPHAYNLDFSMNKIKDASKIKNKDIFRGCPQKVEMNLNLSAKDGEIKWNQNISILDMFYWAFMITRDKPEDITQYEKFMQKEKDNKNIKEMIPFKWSIINEIQKENNNGKYETIKKFTILNDNDIVSGVFNDPNMKKGSKYRIVKRFFIQQGNMQSNAFNDVATTIAQSDALENQINSKEENKSYDLKVKVLKEKEDKPSMAGTYIKKVTYEIKDGKHYIIVSLDRSDWMSDIKAKVEGKEVTPEILNKEKNSDGEELSNIKFEINNLNSKIALGMNVKPMGNARVNFRVVPEDESLNLIKSDLKQSADNKHEEKDDPKDNSNNNNKTDNDKDNKTETKPQKQDETKEEKQSQQVSNDQVENMKKEVDKKKTELQKINEEIEKAKKKVQEEKAKLKNQNEGKVDDLNRAKEELKKLNENLKEIESEFKDAKEKLKNIKETEKNNSQSTDPKQSENKESKKDEAKESNKKEQPVEDLSVKTDINSDTLKQTENKDQVKEKNQKENFNEDKVKNLENNKEDEETGDDSRTVEQNTESKVLPQTGSRTCTLNLLGLGALISSIGAMLFKRRR